MLVNGILFLIIAILAGVIWKQHIDLKGSRSVASITNEAYKDVIQQHHDLLSELGHEQRRVQALEATISNIRKAIDG